MSDERPRWDETPKVEGVRVHADPETDAPEGPLYPKPSQVVSGVGISPPERPIRVLIGGQPFTVRWEDRPGKRLHEDDADYWNLGTTIVAEQQLVIRSLQGEHQLRETVLHEVIHTILSMTAQRDRFKPNDEHEKHPEEPVVAAIATAMLTVLRSNPDLVAWLTQELP